jgi:ABC-type multidrug transport system fused ATPase/permease subunit
VNPGELVCVVGRVGSGKSSLVQAMLGEMERDGGRVAVGGRLAYAAQQAWIINATGGCPGGEERQGAAFLCGGLVGWRALLLIQAG